MKTTELFSQKRVLSFEVFPPKRTAPADTILNAIREMKALRPDFISVTYGASGSDNCDSTLAIATAIKRDYALESVAHLPCINLTREDALLQLGRVQAAGVENILALRGDLPEQGGIGGDFRYASDLIAMIKEYGDFNVIAACYPEGHLESADIVSDIRNLKRKVDAGADQLITQLFLNNDVFYRFRERTALAGIQAPLQAGIMPVINKKQIERIASLSRVSLPKKFTAMMERYENNPEAMRDAGIAYAIDQIVDLITQQVDGIHLYTMNNPYVARKIYEAVHRLMAV